MTDNETKRAILTGLLVAYGSERFTYAEYKQIADVISPVGYLTELCVRGIVTRVHNKSMGDFVYFLTPDAIRYMKEWINGQD